MYVDTYIVIGSVINYCCVHPLLLVLSLIFNKSEIKYLDKLLWQIFKEIAPTKSFFNYQDFVEYLLSLGLVVRKEEDFPEFEIYHFNDFIKLFN